MSSINFNTDVNNNNNYQASEAAITGYDFRLLRKIYKACEREEMQTIEEKMGELSLGCRNHINERMPNIISDESKDLKSAITKFAWQYFNMKNSNSITTTEDTLKLLKLDGILCEKESFTERLENTQRKINILENEINELREEGIINQQLNRKEIRCHEREIRKITKVLEKFQVEVLLVSAEYETEKNEIIAKKKEIEDLKDLAIQAKLVWKEACRASNSAIKDTVAQLNQLQIVMKEIYDAVGKDQADQIEQVIYEAHEVYHTDRKLGQLWKVLNETCEVIYNSANKDQAEKINQIRQILNEIYEVVDNLDKKEATYKAAKRDGDQAKQELSKLKDLLLAQYGRFEIEMKCIHECKDRLDVLKKEKTTHKKAMKIATNAHATEAAKEQLKATKANIKEQEKQIKLMKERIEAIKSGYYIKPAVKSGNNNNNQ